MTVLRTILLATVAVTGCGRADGGDPAQAEDPGPGNPGAALRGTVLVSAASSLTDAFGEMASVFEVAHPGVEVALNLAGSSTLRAQVLEGAPVDVFASANPANMSRVVAAGEVAGEPVVFAGNRLRIAVPAGNPGGVTGLHDFSRRELLVGLCALAVPCGELAGQALDRAGVRPSVDTREPDARALLAKVSLGELDAAVVYATDVAAGGGAVEGIPIPEAPDVEASYSIAVLARAPNPAAARTFVAFVLSGEGRAVLARHGFGVR